MRQEHPPPGGWFELTITTPKVKAGRAGGPHRPLDSRESPLGWVHWAACQSRALLPGGWGVRPPSQPHGQEEEPAMPFWAGQGGVCSAKAAKLLFNLVWALHSLPPCSSQLPGMRVGPGWGSQFLTPSDGIKAPPRPPWRWRNFPAHCSWAGPGPGSGRWQAGGGERATFCVRGLPALLCAGDLPRQEPARWLRERSLQPARPGEPTNPLSHRQGNRCWPW